MKIHVRPCEKPFVWRIDEEINPSVSILKPLKFILICLIQCRLSSHNNFFFINSFVATNGFPLFRFSVIRQTAVAAEPKWTPTSEWVEKDYEAELAKLEKEAEERLEAKVKEMMSKIETTGAK
jgi:hypothetical protein